MKKVSLILFTCGAFFIIFFILPVNIKAAALAEKLKGKILLQVEESGEAWYVNPVDSMRYFLGRPSDALNLFRELGIGVSSKDLEKIPIRITDITAEDSDNDGLSDSLENALGTDINSQDTDSDGFSDRDEILSGHNPNGQGLAAISTSFAGRQSGKIFLQVEAHGEAWYVNPLDGHRYYLGRPKDAFNIMRSFGLGISNDDLNMIIPRTPDHRFSGIEVDIYEAINLKRQAAGLDKLKWNKDLARVAREHSENLARENKTITNITYSCDYPLIHHEGFDFGVYHDSRLNNRDINYFSRAGENIAMMSGAVFKVRYYADDPVKEKLRACPDKRESENSQFKKVLEAEEREEQKLNIILEELSKRVILIGAEDDLNITEIIWQERGELVTATVEGWMNSLGHKENILTPEYDETGIGTAFVNGYLISTQVFIKRAPCGYENGTCCEEEGYYPYCFQGYQCVKKICK